MRVNPLLRTVMVLFITAMFLIPATIASSEDSEEERPLAEDNGKTNLDMAILRADPSSEDDNNGNHVIELEGDKKVEEERGNEIKNPMIDMIKKTGQADGAKPMLSDVSSIDGPVISTTLPGETPMNYMESRRSGRDIWLKDVEITAKPMSKVGIGLVGETTSFLVTFQNNGSAGDVEIRIKTTRQAFDQNENHWQLPVEHKEAKMVSSAGEGAEATVSFDWIPTISTWITVNFTAFEMGDPVDSNNHQYYNWYTGLHGDEANATGGAFRNPGGNFHIAAVHNDQAPSEHSTPNAWTYSNDQTHASPPGNHTLGMPTINQNNFWRDYAIYSFFQFNGLLATQDEHKVLWRVDGGQWATTAWVRGTDPDAAALNTHWYFWSSGEGRPGMQMNRPGTNVEYLIKCGDTGGANKGLYFDDLFIFGVQNYTDVGDFQQIKITDMSLKKASSSDAADNNNNVVIDLEGDPGEEKTFGFEIENTGSALINSISFNVESNPENLDVSFTPASIGTPLNPSGTTTFDVTVTIPEDARASVDYSDETGDKKYNPYIVEFSATATGTNPDSGGAPPEPAEVTSKDKVEVLVTEQPAIEASSSENSKTGAQGDTVQFPVTVENTGNCNLTDDIDAEVEISIDSKPQGFWSAAPDTRAFEIDFDDSEDFTVSVNIPGNAYAGNYQVDVAVEIPEFSIKKIVTLSIGVEQVYDLELELLSDAETEIDPTQQVQLLNPIDFEITNNGNGKDNATFEITPADNADNDWYEIEEETVELDPTGERNDDKEVTVEFNVPEDAKHGYHNFTVKAVSEDDETGDTETDEIQIRFKILRPDLIVSTDVRFDPVSPVVGETTNINVRIFNNGTAPAANFPVYLYIDDELAGFQFVNNAPKNQPKDLLPFEYVFEDDTEYTIKVVADPTGGSKDPLKGNITEINEQNNEYTTSVEVIAPDLVFLPEITVTTDEQMTTLEPDLEAMAYKGKKGELYTITVNVENTGEADAEDIKVNLKIIHLDDTGLDMKELELNQSISALDAGDSGSVSFEWKPERYGTDYLFTFEVDPEDTIPEEDESNAFSPADGFRTAKKPDEGPGFGLALVLLALIGAALILGKKRR